MSSESWQKGRLILPPDVVASIQQAAFLDIFDLWEWVERKFGVAGKAALGRCDRFYLLTVLLDRRDALHPWL